MQAAPCAESVSASRGVPVLGPLEVRAAGHAVPVPGAKPRAVLAMLLLHADRSVGADRMYWILCEAQKAGGRHLGPLGRLIVGEVLTGLIETDPASFLREEPGWEPGDLGGSKGVFSMASFVRFARGEEPE